MKYPPTTRLSSSFSSYDPRNLFLTLRQPKRGATEYSEILKKKVNMFVQMMLAASKNFWVNIFYFWRISTRCNSSESHILVKKHRTFWITLTRSSLKAKNYQCNDSTCAIRFFEGKATFTAKRRKNFSKSVRANICKSTSLKATFQFLTLPRNKISTPYSSEIQYRLPLWNWKLNVRIL